MRTIKMNIIAFRWYLFGCMCIDLLHKPALINLYNTNSLNKHKAFNTYCLAGCFNINGVWEELGLKGRLSSDILPVITLEVTN